MAASGETQSHQTTDLLVEPVSWVFFSSHVVDVFEVERKHARGPGRVRVNFVQARRISQKSVDTDPASGSFSLDLRQSTDERNSNNPYGWLEKAG